VTRPAPGPPRSLARTQQLLAPALREATARLSSTSPALDPLIGYQLGWRDEQGRSVERTAGKALRPTIAILASEAVGGSPGDALLGAVALELIHTFSLAHDDVMDGDAERRHRPSLWARFGLGPAVAAGDALAALAYEVLLREPLYALEAGREFASATIDMIIGQSEDLAFQARTDVTEAECLSMAGRKTGALFACSAALGAILGGGDIDKIERLRTYGRLVGIAFQAIDDLLGIWGDPVRTGKPAASDLREGKRSLPIVHALRAEDGTAAELARLLARQELDAAAIDRARGILSRSDARAWTRSLAERHVDEALEQLSSADLVEQPVAELREIARFVLELDG
jgi:geranylgeranyl diphosphate synthase type I